jgi:hypothetical protein
MGAIVKFFTSLILRSLGPVAMLGGSPCHHGMTRSRVADGRDGVQLWKLATNILNKQPRSNDKGWSSSLGLGVGLTTPHRKEQIRYEKLNKASDLDGFFG